MFKPDMIGQQACVYCNKLIQKNENREVRPKSKQRKDWVLYYHIECYTKIKRVKSRIRSNIWGK